MNKLVLACSLFGTSVMSIANNATSEKEKAAKCSMIYSCSMPNELTAEDDFLNFRLWFRKTKEYGRDGVCPSDGGLCRITTEGGASAGMVTSGSGAPPIAPGDYVGVDEQGNFCLIVVGTAGDKALVGNQFVQSSPFAIEPKLAAELQIKPYTIPAGRYEIQHDGRTAVVIFKVSQK